MPINNTHKPDANISVCCVFSFNTLPNSIPKMPAKIIAPALIIVPNPNMKNFILIVCYFPDNHITYR